MTNILFMDILPNGFFDDASLLKGIFNKKSQKKNAEKRNFYNSNFTKRCYNVITILKIKSTIFFKKRQNDLYMIADLRESEITF
jgi:hypothetical protein